jgi:pimeloyl-ACP methyl ester carboxylesterase
MPVLLLNGIGAPLETWDPLVAVLPDFELIAFDAPGSGTSPAPVVPLSLGDHARIAAELLDILGHDQVAVLGISFGGMVAQELARRMSAPRDRARVRKLVLASTTCGWGGVSAGPGALFDMAGLQREYALSGAPGPVPASGHGYLYQIWAAAGWSSHAWLHEIAVPTLVITGDADTLVPPRNADILCDRLPTAELQVVAGGGHLCLLIRAKEIAPVLRAFLHRDQPVRTPPA